MYEPPAFPVLDTDQSNLLRCADWGMSLRDYFAAKAMQAALSGMDHHRVACMADLATWSYRMADAMLIAREADIMKRPK